jgi:molybdate transport system substrate-binding protein
VAAAVLLAGLALWAAADVSPAAAATSDAAGAQPPVSITVFAAASLNDAVSALAQEFTRTAGIAVRTSFAASSALARQIESGAPADVFFSADTDWMDYLDQKGRIEPGTRADVVANRLVLIAPADRPITLRIGPRFPLAAALGSDGHLAVGDPDSVPAGRYARAALTALGVWDSVQARLVRCDNVRVALAFVARGEVPLGIVYATDALIDQRVSIVGEFPADSHAPIVYPAALVQAQRPAARQAAALQFLAVLRGPEAGAVFTKFGFTALVAAPFTPSGAAGATPPAPAAAMRAAPPPAKQATAPP